MTHVVLLDFVPAEDYEPSGSALAQDDLGELPAERTGPAGYHHGLVGPDRVTHHSLRRTHQVRPTTGSQIPSLRGRTFLLEEKWTPSLDRAEGLKSVSAECNSFLPQIEHDLVGHTTVASVRNLEQ